MLFAGEAHLALVFERPGADERESFQEVGQEILVAVMSPRHPEAMARQGRLRLEDLGDIRQVAVAGRGRRGGDPRLLLARQIWRTDSRPSTPRPVPACRGT